MSGDEIFVGQVDDEPPEPRPWVVGADPAYALLRTLDLEELRTDDGPPTPQPGDDALRPLLLSDKGCFDSYAARLQIPLSDYSFANNFCWQGPMWLRYAIFNDCFCLFCWRDGLLTMPLPPLGAPDRIAAALRICLELLHEHNPPGADSAVEFVAPQVLAAIRDYPSRHLDALDLEPGRPDFVYRRQDLADMVGGGYHAKRKEINQLLNGHGQVAVETLSTEHRPELMLVLRGWILSRLAIHGGHSEAVRYARDESVAICSALVHMEALRLDGLVVRVDGEVAAFTLGERLLPGVGNILFEKTRLDMKGLPPFIFREYSRAMSDCHSIVTGDDLGLPGLHASKMSYRPSQLAEKWTIRAEARGPR